MTEKSLPVPPSWEDQLPEPQQKLNRFCENWIFAFIVAMAIRHFVIEPFRIPTASMEPTLYGDSALSRSDFVVVDKFFSRFQAVKRFDVTVFQFPHPEVSAPGGQVIPALDANGKRIDSWLPRPPVYRNFVKRAVILPGETFYIANGDIFIKGVNKDNGVTDTSGFVIARKPAATQEEVWEQIYAHGHQTAPEMYVPWKADDGASVDGSSAGALAITVKPASLVTFTQSFRNLYIKPGLVRVQSKLSNKAPVLVDIALDAPLFSFDKRIGNIWDMEDWWEQRITTNDLDNPDHGALLNVAMRERVGDIRIHLQPTAITGTVTCVLAEGSAQSLRLELTPQSWALRHVVGDAAPVTLAEGAESLLNHQVSFASLDDEAVLAIDGAERHRSAILTTDPQGEFSTVHWEGAGSITVSAISMDRDLHYCANGFLMPERLHVPAQGNQGGEIGAKEMYRKHSGNLNSVDPYVRANSAKYMFHETDVRAQMVQRDISGVEIYRPMGFSEATAITAPANGYLLMGDNSPMSWDGRNWGWVPSTNIRGRVVLRIRSQKIGDRYIPFLNWSLVR